MIDRSMLWGLVAALGSLAIATAPGVAQEPAVLDGAVLFKDRTCWACHGLDAKTPILPEYPKLAGQNPLYMLRQMKDIKSGARDNGNTPAMRGIMHLVTEAEMEAIVDYVSSLEP
jgi:cytochrome c